MTKEIKFSIEFNEDATMWNTQGVHDILTGSVGQNPDKVVYGAGDLYGAAILTCFLGAFKTFAKNSNLIFERLETDATLYSVPDQEEKYSFTKIVIKTILYGVPVDHQEQAKLIYEKASHDCTIARSIKTEKEIHLEFA